MRRRTRRIFILLLILIIYSSIATSEEDETPESMFRRTVASWQSATSSSNQWRPWQEFAKELLARFERTATQVENNNRLEVVGALEEGILMIERAVFEGGQGANPPRDAALSQLYTTYSQTLSNLTPQECLDLAMDPHTLLIGAETVDKTQPGTHICMENAENSLRNAASLDATNQQAEELLQSITGEDTAHKRKPKEFVAELFDSFADSFDDKLLKTLQYKVPGLVGALAQKLVVSMSSKFKYYEAVLDAGCGTGLAGRYLRPLVVPGGPIVGVDASQKMLDKAATCTLTTGCGLEATKAEDDDADDKSPPLYDALLKMDLEEMTVQNTLQTQIPYAPAAFDLIVAADVLVYFGSLENLISTFARVSSPGGHLIFSCELATESEAPLGWRLLASGRFAHTKKHATDVASDAGYELAHYEEIVPRIEKGEPVRGHLFGFSLRRSLDSTEL
jgi:predicted TPR repeat methyltransferase